MKLTVRWSIFALILLLLGAILLLAIITSNSSLWLSILAILVAALGVVGTFSQWLFPVSAGGSETSPISDTTKQSTAGDKIIVDHYQRQTFEEQKNRVRRKKRNRSIFSVGSAVVVVLSVIAFYYLQSSSQISFMANDNDYKSRVTSIAWSPNGMLVASTTQVGSVRIWNVAKRATTLMYPGDQNQNMYNAVTDAYNNLSWSPDGRFIAFGNNDDKIRVANVSNPQSQLLYVDAGSSQVVNTVVWSPDGKYIAFGGESANVYIRNLNNKPAFVTYTNTAPITALAWSRNGKFIASGGRDGKVHVWSVATGKDVFSTPNYSGKVTSLAWSPTALSLIASASSDSRVDVWDISKSYIENPVVPYEEKHAGSIDGVAWSPDGKEIVSGDEEGTLRIWDAATGSDLSIYQDYLHPTLSNTDVVVSAVGWSSDGRSIAIGHSEYGKYGGYNYYHTVKIFTFCRSWCLFQ
jgi:WD40 repeat protein